MIKKLLALASTVVLSGFGVIPSAQAASEQNLESIIVKSSVANPAELQIFNGQQIEEMATNTFILSLPSGLSFERAKNAYLKFEHVEYVEPNLPIEVQTADDTEFISGNLWGMESGFGTNAASAWANGYTGSDQVYVAVIDSGIDTSHPDLAANMWTNSGEIAGNGIDDDGNGFVDDVHGYDFLNDDGSVNDASENPHGTHVAGTIGAVGNNAIGVSGVAQNVKIISAKISNTDGASKISNAIKAIDYITQLRTQKGLDIVATNNSWGGVGYSKALEEAIQRGGDAGIVFVAAAGNSASNNDGSEQFPGNLDCTTELRDWDCLVVVSALDEDGSLADYSNFGSSSVDIGAPGSDIVSTQHGGGYVSLSGTSMAAPHVTGALALCVASNRGIGGEMAIQYLLSSAVATPSLSGKVSSGARVDASAMASLCASQSESFSGAPESMLATALYTDTGKIEWDDLSTGEYEFKIEYRQGADGCRGTFEHLAYIGPQLTSYPLTGLSESEFYCFRIQASRDSSGSSFVNSNVMITWTSNLPFIGGTVYLADGVTPVSGIEMNWLPTGSRISSYDRDAVSVLTDKNGDFLIQVSNDVPGQLYAQTSRHAARDPRTSPVTPWGMIVSGELTIQNDVSVDFTLPEQHLLTFEVSEQETGLPIKGATVSYTELAEYCEDGSHKPFATATNTSCLFWPTGFTSSAPQTDSNGKVTIAVLDSQYIRNWPETWIFNVRDPKTGRFSQVSVDPSSDQTIDVEIQSSVVVSGTVLANDGTTTVAGMEMNWLPAGLDITQNDRRAITSISDSDGKYSLEVPPGVDGQLYAQTSRNADSAAKTSPITPWGLEAWANLNVTDNTETDFVLPRQHVLTFRVTDEDSGEPISGVKISYPDMAEHCEENTWSPFEGATGGDCEFWPAGIGSRNPTTNASGEVSIAVLAEDYSDRWPEKWSFSLRDPVSERFKQVSIDPYLDQVIEVEFKTKVALSGVVHMSDGKTPVSGIEMNWLPAGQDITLNDDEAITDTTDANGRYELTVPPGSEGQLYAQTSRRVGRSAPTVPLTPWGFEAWAEITVQEDSVVDFELPEMDLITIKVVDWASDEPVKGARINYPEMAEHCEENTWTPFEGASGSDCEFWPAGIGSFNPLTDANGEVQLAIVGQKHGDRWPEKFEFKVTHPNDVSRVVSKSWIIEDGQTYKVNLPGTPSRPEQPEVTALTEKVILTWDEPWNGGAFIDFYKVWQSPNADGPFTLVENGSCEGNISPSLRACEVEGLEPGTAYYFAIIAHNVYGYSELSLASVAKTQTQEDAPLDQEPANPVPEETPEESPVVPEQEDSQESDQETPDSSSESPATEESGPEQGATDQESTEETPSGEAESSEREDDTKAVDSDLVDGQAKVDDTVVESTREVSEDKRTVVVSVPGMSVELQPSGGLIESEQIEFDSKRPTDIQLSGLESGSVVNVYQIQEDKQALLVGKATVDPSGSADVTVMTWAAKGQEKLKLNILSTDSQGKSRQIAVEGSIKGSKTANSETTDEVSRSSETKANAGSFKGYVAIYAKGFEGQRLSAKVGKDWIIVPELQSRFERVVDYIGLPGIELTVRIYIDRQLEKTISLITKK